jgi:hypothetical protein
MKSFLSILLSFSILLSGCTSFYPLTDEDRSEGRPAIDEQILIKLKDGRSIEVEPYHYVTVTEPSDFVYGEGFNNRTFRQLRGKLNQSLIDSSVIERGSLTCWLHDGTPIVFRENDYVEVTFDGGTGLWCAGKYQNGEIFTGRVDHVDIREIHVGRDPLTPLYIGAVLGGVAGAPFGVACESCYGNKGERAGYFALIGAGVGFAVGGIIVLNQSD